MIFSPHLSSVSPQLLLLSSHFREEILTDNTDPCALYFIIPFPQSSFTFHCFQLYSMKSLYAKEGKSSAILWNEDLLESKFQTMKPHCTLPVRCGYNNAYRNALRAQTGLALHRLPCTRALPWSKHWPCLCCSPA